MDRRDEAMTALHAMGAALLRRLAPERAHRATLWALGHDLGPIDRHADDPILATRIWGREFANPFGLAAGFDKNGVAADAALAMGFGFTEVGGVTPRPQPGNPRPRLFRLAADGAVINRMGFNSDGMAAVAERLAARRRRDRPVGVNLASNTDSTDPAADFEALVARFAAIVDFMTVDISCPNTASGRLFLDPGRLTDLLDRLRRRRDTACDGRAPTPLLVKLAPDGEDAEIEALVRVAARADGLIATNTSAARPAGLTDSRRREAGGLSGRPLFGRSTEVLRLAYRVGGGRIPLVGVGGVASGADAYAKIRAGASLVQLYTALVYAGPDLVRRIKVDLARRLHADGFASLAEAVGADHRAAAAAPQAAPAIRAS